MGEHTPPKSVCDGLIQSAEDEIAAATLYGQTARLMENCAMDEAPDQMCPDGGGEMMEMAETVRKIDDEERTHGLQFVEMLDALGCGTASKRGDLQKSMQKL